jgi:hypothetical protein
MSARCFLLCLIIFAMSTVVVGAFPAFAETATSAPYAADDLQKQLILQARDEGYITHEQAEQYIEDARLLVETFTSRVELVPVEGSESVEEPIENESVGNEPSTAAAIKCKWAWPVRLHVDSLGARAFSLEQNLYWCWNGKTVSRWSGVADWDITTWGYALGITWEGWNYYKEFIPYRLGGNFPGGIHLRSKGTFKIGKWPWSPRHSIWLDHWGHYNGTWDYAHDDS